MAPNPYSMDVNVHNQTPVTLWWMGVSTHSANDEQTSLVRNEGSGARDSPNEIQPNSTGRFTITKKGGIHGLFTALTWTVAPRMSPWSDKVMFTVYSQMPAGLRAKASVQLADVSAWKPRQFSNSDFADGVYKTPDNAKWADVFDQTYRDQGGSTPNATYRVRD